MPKILGVKDGREPHEVLYDVVLHEPERLWFHIGRLVSLKGGIRSFFNRLIPFRNDDGLLLKDHGGELLTRCDENLLPRQYIGRAFCNMSSLQLREMFPSLLEQQLKFIATLNVSNNKEYYSVNLEGVDNDLVVWRKIGDLLCRYGHLPINIELKENEQLCPQVMSILAKVCESTRMEIYIDDLCSCFHELPESEEYLVMLIDRLSQYIKAVKIDYMIMQKIMTLDGFYCVKRHLTDFSWLWKSFCSEPLPTVIFESMPIKNAVWLGHLGELAWEYPDYQFQIG